MGRKSNLRAFVYLIGMLLFVGCASTPSNNLYYVRVENRCKDNITIRNELESYVVKPFQTAYITTNNKIFIDNELVQVLKDSYLIIEFDGSIYNVIRCNTSVIIRNYEYQRV